MHKPVVAVVAVFMILLIVGGPGTAASKTMQDCQIGHRVCYRSCKGLEKTCEYRCDMDLAECVVPSKSPGRKR
jgi:hypothetical protein